MDMSGVPIISGQTGVIFGIDGCRWWAENGLICYETIENVYGTQSVKQTLERLQGINDLVGDRQFDKGFHTRDEVKATQRFITQMLDLCRQAQVQGSPDDPSAVRDKKRRRRKVVRVPNPSTSF